MKMSLLPILINVEKSKEINLTVFYCQFANRRKGTQLDKYI